MKNMKFSKNNLNKIKIHVNLSNVITPKTEHTHGGTYEGERVEGVKQGQGTFIYTDGSKYVGQWTNNQMHGQGTLT